MYRGIYTAPPNAEEGIQMVYMPDRQVIRFDGWCHGRQGAIQPVDMSLSDVLHGLGISLEDCRRALGTTEQAAQPMAPPVQRAASESVPRTVAVPSEVPPPGPR
jgi:hypothetical protein